MTAAVLEEFAVDRRGVDHDARGRFTRGSAVGRALDAGESLDGFSRERLQREVRRRNKEGAGIKVRRGATADEIRAALQSPQSPQKVDGNDRIEARRALQARIDAVRAVSNPARKVYQDAGAAGRAEDWAKIDEVDRDLRRVGARLFGMPETIFQFDRERHKIIEEEPGDRERTGGRMIGVRPGAFWDEEGIVLDKAEVMPAVESEAEVAAYWREQEIDVHALMKQREQAWKQGTQTAAVTDEHGNVHDALGRFANKWTDGRPSGGGFLRGEDALNSVPAKMTRPPAGRSGNYEGAKLDAPEGHGDVLPLAEYEGLEYGAINGLLRGDYDRPYERKKWHTPEQEAADRAFIEDYRARNKAENTPRVAEIDKTMAVSPLSEAVEVQRVVRHGRAIWGEDIWFGDMALSRTDDFDEQDKLFARWEAGERPDLTGLRWKELAYVSTTASDSFAAHHARNWHGDRGEGEPIIMDIEVPAGVGAIQLSEWGEVGEILLQRGLEMEVAADNGVDEQGFRRLKIRVVPSA